MSDAKLELFKGSGPLVVRPDTLFAIVKAIIQAGPGREAEFLKLANRFDQAIEVTNPELVNLVKTFLHQNKLFEAGALVRAAVESPPGSTSCFEKKL